VQERRYARCVRITSPLKNLAIVRENLELAEQGHKGALHTKKHPCSGASIVMYLHIYLLSLSTPEPKFSYKSHLHCTLALSSLTSASRAPKPHTNSSTLPFCPVKLSSTPHTGVAIGTNMATRERYAA
jgi:hypothetical protein